MPSSFEKNKQGKYVMIGAPGVERALIPEQEAAPVKQQQPKPKPKPKPKGFFEKIGNDLNYEAKQLMVDPVKSYGRMAQNYFNQGSISLASEGVIGSSANATKVMFETLEALKGSKFKNRQRALSQFDNLEDNIFSLLGKKKPSEMTQGERNAYGLKSSTVLNIAAGGALGGLGKIAQGVKYIGPVATKLGQALEITNKTSKIATAGKIVARAALEEAITTPLDDNRGGSAVALLNAVMGQEVMKDPVQPGMSISEAGRAAYLPNAALAGGIGIGILGIGSIRRARKGARNVAEQQQARSDLEKEGVTQSNPETGQTAFKQSSGRSNKAQGSSKASEQFADKADVDAAFDAAMAGNPPAPQTLPVAPATAVDGAAVTPAAAVDGVAEPFTLDNLPAFRAEQVEKSNPWKRAAPDRKGVGFPDEYSEVQEWLRQRELPNTPDYANLQNWLEQNEQRGGIPSQQMEPGGAVMGDFATTADEAVDPWAIEYDPALPEADSAMHVFNQLDDGELDAVMNTPAPLEAANGLIAARQSGPVNPATRTSLTAAPTEIIADPLQDANNPLSNAEVWRSQWEVTNTDVLRDLASQDNSPELFGYISNATGRDWNEFTKNDILDGLEQLRQTGILVMPNRLQGGQSLALEEMFIDPPRFQYKEGIDEQGQQLGNSLAGIEKWNTAIEGIVDVWLDPVDGKTYIINGHNRYAAALRMGIPSLNVRYITAGTAEAAKLEGAFTNIATGAGTAFDAAKLFKGLGVTDKAQLNTGGIPMSSGLAKQGLAMSKLPDNLFQDAVNGIISQPKAQLLGESGLDEAGMQQAVKALQNRNVDETVWKEVLQQAKSAPVVQGTQVDLFGNTETMNLMVQKGQLAAQVRGDLVKDKNFMNAVGRNVDRLNNISGNNVDEAGTKQVAMDAQSVLGEFEAGKYASDHPISTLLNEGALEISAGKKMAVIAKRIKQQILDAAVNSGTSVPAKVEIPVKPKAVRSKKLTTADRTAVRAELVQREIDNGNLRPPTTPMPELLSDSNVDVSKVLRELEEGVISDDALRMAQDELELKEAYAEMDAETALAQTAQVRDEAGYELLTFDEKVTHGSMPQLFDVEVMPRETPIADAFAELAKELAQSDARLYRKSGEYIQNTNKNIDALANDVLDQDRMAAYAKEQYEQAVKNGDKNLQHEWKVKGQRIEKARIKQSQARLDATQSEMLPTGQYDDSTPLLNAEVVPKPRRKLSEQLGADLNSLGQKLGALTRTIDENLTKQEARLAERQAGLKEQFAEHQAGLKEQFAKLYKEIEIPNAAARPLKNIKAHADALVKHTGIDPDEAYKLVQAKGKQLNTDLIPGMPDFMETENDLFIGRTTENTLAYRAAYEKFYGVRTGEHLKISEATAIERKLAIDNEIEQIRNQANTEGC